MKTEVDPHAQVITATALIGHPEQKTSGPHDLSGKGKK